MGVGGQGGGLHRQHREDAGHQVEDQPAEEGERQRQRQADGGAGRGGRSVIVDRRRRQGSAAQSSGRDRARRGRNLPCPVAERQHPGDGGRRLAGADRDPGRQAEGQAVGAPLDGLGLGVVQDRGVERKEIGPRQVGAFERRARDGQPQRLAFDGVDGGEARGLRGGDQRSGDPVAPDRVGPGGGGDDRHLQRQTGVFRHAGQFADQEGGVRLQRHRGSDRRRGGNLDRDRQQHLARIAVVEQRPDRHAGRGRPDDLARLPAGGQRPFDRGRLAGIAGIAPVGMPALVDLLAQGDVDRPAGNRAALLGDQFGLQVAGVDRRGGGEGRPQQREDNGEGGEKAAHDPSIWRGPRPLPPQSAATPSTSAGAAP